MTNNEVWQQLLSLESRDAVTRWFSELHGRELNARRAKEIVAAAKQAREFFRNATESAYSVRPLLTFYGVACLSRSLVLLLRTNGGEETLTGGHGIETVNWSGTIGGEIGAGLAALPTLRIRTTAGLFSELVSQTNNLVTLHVSSSAVDWSLPYNVPPAGVEVTLADLCSRMPDLKADYTAAGGQILYAPVGEMTYSAQDGWRARLTGDAVVAVREFLVANGYAVAGEGSPFTVTANAQVFGDHTPLFVQSYVHKAFNAIPHLHVARPLDGGRNYSQLTLTYMVGFILGMLARYYPTHWIALSQGEKGDSWWPTINRAQHLVEVSFPELVVELISVALKEAKARAARR